MNQNNYNYQGKSGKTIKARKTAALPQKRRKAAYRNLEDFLRSNLIASTNQYGDLIISGSRIC